MHHDSIHPGLGVLSRWLTWLDCFGMDRIWDRNEGRGSQEAKGGIPASDHSNPSTTDTTNPYIPRLLLMTLLPTLPTLLEAWSLNLDSDSDDSYDSYFILLRLRFRDLLDSYCSYWNSLLCQWWWCFNRCLCYCLLWCLWWCSHLFLYCLCFGVLLNLCLCLSWVNISCFSRYRVNKVKCNMCCLNYGCCLVNWLSIRRWSNSNLFV